MTCPGFLEVGMTDIRHSAVGEGTDVGLIGGLAVAAWFLVLDTIAGHPFQTPSLLGQMVILGDRQPDPVLAFGAILLYTAFHFIVFGLIGIGLVALVHWAVDNPVVRYALLPVFLVFEVLFYGLLTIFSERTQELFPFWAVLSANTLAALAMGAYLWRRHPGLRDSVRETPLGAAPR
jgi:hypothetical protein